MYDPKQFFDKYLVDHFLYKVMTLKNIIEKYESIGDEVLSGVQGVEDDKYIDTLRLEIRSTYYQAIETLFELIFSLWRETHRIDNTNIWYFLSTGPGVANYKRIEQIAEGEIAFLDEVVVAGHRKDGSEIEVSLGRYIFYLGVHDDKLEDRLVESLKVIKSFLIEFAKEFSDRAEYNAIKHALRIFPTVTDMFVKAKKEDKWAKLLDMSGSMSFLTESKKKGKLNVHVVPLDTERDFRMTLMCSGLISNIVRTRKRVFGNSNEPLSLAFPSEENLREMSKREAQLVNFTFSMTPVYESEDDDP